MQPQVQRSANIFIVAFVALQVGLPAAYYVGDDPFDERFAWRMFSPVRLARCTVEAFDATDGSLAPIRLSRELHVVWINLLKRARPAVIDAVADRLCERRSDVRMRLSCTPPDSVLRGVCMRMGDRDRNGVDDALQDGDGDGIPDGYDRTKACAKGEGAACFAADCGELSAQDCHRKICRVVIKDSDEPLCGGDS